MTIMVGCQGSGKSTWAKTNRSGATHCSADSYFQVGSSYRFDPSKLGKAHGACFRKAVEAIQAGENVVIDNTNSTVTEIAPYYALAQAYGVNVEIVQMTIDPEVSALRNVHGVPGAGVKATAKRCANLSIPPFWAVTRLVVPNYGV